MIISKKINKTIISEKGEIRVSIWDNTNKTNEPLVSLQIDNQSKVDKNVE